MLVIPEPSTRDATWSGNVGGCFTRRERQYLLDYAASSPPIVGRLETDRYRSVTKGKFESDKFSYKLLI